MADTLVYEITVGLPAAGDVVSRRLTTVVDGLAQEVKEFPAATTTLGLLSVPQDAEVLLSLTDVDDAGNYSEPAVVEFVAADTIAPPVPGSFGVTLVGEVSAPEPEVQPEPEVVPEPAVTPEPEADPEV